MSLIENKHCEHCETQCLSCENTNNCGAYAESHLKERYEAYHDVGYEAGTLHPGLIEDLKKIRDLSLDDDIRFLANRWIPE